MSKAISGICQNCGENALLYMVSNLMVCYWCKGRKV